MSEAPEPNQPDVTSILDQIQQGDSLAETELHKKFVGRLVRLASKRINSRFRAKVEPEEVVQSVFATFFRRNREGEFEFDDWNELWSLLVRITICKCVNKIERFTAAKRNVELEYNYQAKPNSNSSTPPFFTEPTAEEVAIFNETLDQLLDHLPEPQQTIVGLRLQGLSNLEISQRVQRSERTVYRFLEQIKDSLIAMMHDTQD